MVAFDTVTAAGRWPDAKRPTGLGLMVPVSERAAFGGTPHFADVLEISKVAADVGFDALWFADHFTFGSRGDGGYRGAWDVWTLMAAVAAAVPSVQIGTLVACTAYRNPGVIAKMTEMIDDISDGRFILGLGAGWHRPEYDQFGIPFEPRFSRFAEAMQIILPMLREGQADFQGVYYQADDMQNLPRGPRAEGPPIMIGSSSPKMLQVLARHADAWNTGWHNDVGAVQAKIGALDAACTEAGRDPATVIRTIGCNLARDGYTGSRPDALEGGDEAHVQLLHDCADAGFHHVICGVDPCTPQSIEAFGRVIEAFDSGR